MKGSIHCNILARRRSASMMDMRLILTQGTPMKTGHSPHRIVVLLLAIASSVCVVASPVLAADRPNVIFIFADDHAYQAISAYDDKLIQTPHIDRLAKEGMLFENCFVTNSICGPMRAVVQTGKYSHLNGFTRNGGRFNGNQWTFPKELQKSGYQTAVVGKWHLGEHQAPQGYDYSEVLVGQGTYYNPKMLVDAQGSGDNRKRQPIVHEGYVTDVVTDRALWWLKQGRDKSKPFMLMYQHKAPHREWSPGPDHLETFADKSFPEPATLFEDYSKQVKPRQMQAMEVGRHMKLDQDLKVDWAPGNLTPSQRAAYLKAFKEGNEAFKKTAPKGDDFTRWAYQRYMRLYLSCIKSIDDNVGRMLNYLDESGLAENTIVIYCSDQGFYLGEHGWYDKRWVYEESLRTPFLVRWPGTVKPGSRRAEIVSPLDFAATFLEMAGAADQVPDNLNGESLVPLMKGETPADWRKYLYYHYYEYPAINRERRRYHMVHPHYAVVDGRYKLIHFYGDADVWELIDLKADPLEQTNFYDRPDYADVQKKLQGELARLRQELAVPDIDPDMPRQKKAPAKTAVKQVLRLMTPTNETRSDLDPSDKAFTIGASVLAQRGEGVIAAQGGKAFGWSLYLQDGVPHFTIRNGHLARTVKADRTVAVGKKAHVAGMLDDDGKLRVYVDGRLAGKADGLVILEKPADELSVGRDTLGPVGEYDNEFALAGDLKDLRLYWGQLGDDALLAWAGGVAANPTKTLVAWASPGNLTQQGGSVLTVQDAGRFDAIVLGERVAGKWMPGSDHFERTKVDQSGWPDETASADTLVQIAIVYADERIHIYRNGEPYADYPALNIDLLSAENSIAVFGLRHVGAASGTNFVGTIDDARIYDRALTAEQIQSLKPNKPSEPKPIAWWDFEDGKATDRVGRFPHSIAKDGAKIDGGKLVLNGKGYLIAAPTEAEARRVTGE